MKQKEEDLTKLTEHLEKRNLKFQKEKHWMREKTQEIDLWVSEAKKEEEVVQGMRLQMVRRKEMVAKKEINVLDWTKRNMQDKSKVGGDKSDLEEIRESNIQEEKELNEKMRKLKRKEFDELAKKGRLMEAKKDSLRKLREE